MGGGEPLKDQQMFSGQIVPGNIDLSNRPVIKNPDGTVSTEKSFSIGTDKGEVLIPQVVNGRLLSKQDAIEHYKLTGEHLGIFKDVASANTAAEMIHNRGQARVIIPEVGAAKYWYVDPRAYQSPPHEDQGESMQRQAELEALNRILLPAGTQPSF